MTLSLPVLCVVAFAVALAIAQQWSRRIPYSLVWKLALGGTALLVLRGAAGVVQDIYIAAFRGNLRLAAVLWDLWFCLGAILFGISVRQFSRARKIRDPLRSAHY